MDIQTLYTGLKDNGAQLPDAQTFTARMQSDPKYVETIRNAAGAMGAQVPDSSTFASKYLTSQLTQTGPHDFNGSTILGKMPNLDAVTGAGGSPADLPEPTMADKLKSLFSGSGNVAKIALELPAKRVYGGAHDLLNNLYAGAGSAYKKAVSTLPEIAQPGIMEQGKGNTLAEDFRAIRDNPKPGVIRQVATDPLMYLPMGEGTGALKALSSKFPVLKPATKFLSEATGLPSQFGRDVEKGLAARAAQAQAVKKGSGAVEDIARLARDRAATKEAQSAGMSNKAGMVDDEVSLISDAPFVNSPDIDPYLAERLAGSVASTGKAVAELPSLASRVAAAITPLRGAELAYSLAKTAPGKAAISALKGAGQMTAFGSIDRGLQGKGYAPNIMDPLLGGLSGGIGSALQSRAMERFPSMEATSNRYIRPDAIEHLKENLPEILSKGLLPSSKYGFNATAKNELRRLGEGAYEGALAKVSSTNAGKLKGLNIRGDDIAADLEGVLASNKQMAKRKDLGSDFGSPERMSLRKDINNYVDQSIPTGFKNKEELRQKLLDHLNDSKTPSDFSEKIPDLLEKFGSTPYHGIALRDVTSDMGSAVRAGLQDPHNPVSYIATAEGKKAIPNLIRKDMADKLVGIKGKMMNKNLQEEALSPRFLMDVRNSMTSPRAYENRPGNEAMSMQLANEAFHDAINKNLQKIPEYSAALGEAPKRYALWKTLEDLTVHPGNTGLADRLFGLAMNPFSQASAMYKAGNAMQRLAPAVVGAETVLRSAKSPKDSTSKGK